MTGAAAAAGYAQAIDSRRTTGKSAAALRVFAHQRLRATAIARRKGQEFAREAFDLYRAAGTIGPCPVMATHGRGPCVTHPQSPPGTVCAGTELDARLCGALSSAGGKVVKVTETGLAAAIRREVAARVGELRYNLWFRDNTKFELDGGELVVGVPNLFFQDWLSANFLGLLREAAHSVTGHAVRVRIVVDPELFRQMRRNEAAPPSQSRPTNGTAVSEGDESDETKLPAARYRFENFVVGPCNELAVVAAKQVAQNPGRAFNPLVLYGPFGTGKTHLLRAIEHQTQRRRGSSRPIYLTSEAFTNRFLEAMQARKLSGFRKEMRSTRFLLLDDIQFIARTNATQRELLHTIDELVSNNHQVVVTCDQHPSFLNALSEPLRERLVTGFTCELALPDRETRRRILETKAAAIGLQLSEPVKQFVIDHVIGNVRELEGAVNRLLAAASLRQRKLTVETAREALVDLLHRRVKRVTLRDIERAVCRLFQLDTKTIRSRSRATSIAYPRMLAMYLARKHTGASYEAIGKHFGGRLHTTVMAAERRVRQWLQDRAILTIGGASWPVEEALAAIERSLGY